MYIPNWYNYMMGGGGGGRTVTKKKRTATTESVEFDDVEGPGGSGPGGNGGGDGNGPGGDGNGGENGPGGGGDGPGGNGDGPEDGNEDDHEDEREEEEESQETGENGEDEADDDDDDDGGTELGTVVYAAYRIPYAAIITDGDVHLGAYPKKHITRQMLTHTNQAMGMMAAQEISAHALLTWDMLVSPHHYVTAATRIPAGHVIRSEDLSYSASARSSTSRFEDKHQVIGKLAARTIPPNTAITKSMLK